MKNFNFKAFPGLLLLCLFISSQALFAQLNTPRGSQMAKVSQRVGITDITITYSRPSVNGREIWGKVVPYGMNYLQFGTAKESPWRAGANENTVIEFTHDVLIAGTPVKAGKYGLHLEIKENGAANVILSSNSTSWGSYFYDPNEDAAKVAVKTEEVPHRELLTYEFVDVDANSATAALIWEKKMIPFKIDVQVKDIVLADIRNKLTDSPGFNRQTWEQAASYSLNNGGNLDEAMGWINNAISGQFFSQKTFNNMSIKAQILMKQAKMEEAFTVMDEALPMGTAPQVHQYGQQLITVGQKQKALEVFKWNAKANKGAWPVHYGLARGYSAVGNYKTALKHAKIALNNAPNKPNKDAIAANIEKLNRGEDIN